MARVFQYQKQEQQKGFASLLLLCIFWLANFDITYLHSCCCCSALPSSSSWLHLIDTGLVCLSPNLATLITNGSMTSTHLSFQVDATEPHTHQVISLNSTLLLPLGKQLRFLAHLFCIDRALSHFFLVPQTVVLLIHNIFHSPEDRMLPKPS